jgi:RNA exonuclease 1
VSLCSWPGLEPQCRSSSSHTASCIVFSESVLVGHSMENDLMALKIVHKRIVDTGMAALSSAARHAHSVLAAALLFPHPKGPPLKSALRYLTKKWLRRDIQQGQSGAFYSSSTLHPTAVDLLLSRAQLC